MATKRPEGALRGGFPPGAVKVGSQGLAGKPCLLPGCATTLAPTLPYRKGHLEIIMSSPASLKQLLLRVFKVTGQQSSCRPVQPLVKTQPRDPWPGSDDTGERHRRGCRVLPVTTLRAGEEGVLGYAPARKRRGWGRGSAQLCRCHRDGFPELRHWVATSRAFPPPTCGTGRQWLSPKRSSCT